MLVDNQRQGLAKKQTLTEAEVAEIEQLAALCNNYEDLHLDFGWLRSRTAEANDFLYYANGILAGYLNISSYGTREKELTGMVHPEYRRKGIFRMLLAAAKEECLQRGVQKVLLVCEHTSASGLAFAAAMGAQHEFSEHAMVLGLFQEKGEVDEWLQIRQADVNETEALISIMATDLSTVEEAKSYVMDFVQQPNQRFYLAVFGEQPIGCLRLDEMEDEVGIYGFVVHPDYRGRGYGRQLLEAVIPVLQAESQKRITLEVETDNLNAFGLYRSCGFQVKTTYDYYAVNVH